MILLTLFTLAGCGSGKKAPETAEDFNRSDLVLAVADGYIFEETAKRALPNARIVVFPSREDTYKAVLSGAADGLVDDEPVIRSVMRSQDEFRMAEGLLEESDYGFAFPKNANGEKLAAEISAYIAKQRENGELTLLDEKWFGEDTGNKKSEDAYELPAVNGSLTVAFENDSIPFLYLSAGRPTGYEADLLIGFCREMGYALSFQEMDFADLLSETAAGNVDVACGAVTITEDRRENLIFSEPDYTGGVAVCMKKEGVIVEEDGGNEWTRHFRNTFLDDQRYLLFLKGVGVTCLMAFLSTFLGTLLGRIFFVISRRASWPIRGLIKGILWVLGGIPAVILMMQLYYAYYRNLLAGGVISSVIAFTLVFGRSVYRIIERRALEVAKGRLERDYRVEEIETKDFFSILWDKKGEAIREDYIEAVITLIKVTSVAGYIAVQDLVSVLDAIRMESYEILMPLAAATIVYFVLIKVVTLLLRALMRRSHQS